MKKQVCVWDDIFCGVRFGVSDKKAKITKMKGCGVGF